MESAENVAATEMTTLAVEATGVDAEATGLANGTTGVDDDVQVATDADEAMDIQWTLHLLKDINTF